ncbi:HalOD1 output domain-containing protein [Natrinema salinisoli]|uniref:HalOD1 output domain-containing protein n=1 Tax=Natrinema salinisoli TaxID=2878535 RepID=UPI001CF05149|nr:HalOD1 output domain-containing protein [Natrinema salinisoli]
MNYEGSRPRFDRWENHLLVLSGLVALVCVAFISATPGPKFFEIPEVIVPLGVSIGLSLYTVRLQRRNRPTDRPDPMITYVWAGALASGAIGAFWMGLHLYYGLPIDVLPDKILTVLSGGLAVGVFLGRSASTGYRPDADADRARVVAETSWTTPSEPSSILEAVVETLADLEGVDPHELGPLYDSIDPEVFDGLQAQDDSHWQLLFYADEYEVRVNSHGTVTVYSLESPDDRSRPTSVN